MIATTKEERIRILLDSTGREGMDGLIGYLRNGGFFKGPASATHHGCEEGGLAAHSLRVYELLSSHHARLRLDMSIGAGQKPLPLVPGSLEIAGLLHDVCKMGAYVKSEKGTGWAVNRQKDKGHAVLSIARIKEYIMLTELEEMMIRYHMGVYGLNEFQESSGEYPLRGDHIACEGMTKDESKDFRYGKSMANAWYHNPLVKLMSICDEMATMEEKAKEIL